MMSEMMKKMSKRNLKGMSDKGIPPDLLNQLKLEAKDVLRKGEKDFKTFCSSIKRDTNN